MRGAPSSPYRVTTRRESVSGVEGEAGKPSRSPSILRSLRLPSEITRDGKSWDPGRTETGDPGRHPFGAKELPPPHPFSP